MARKKNLERAIILGLILSTGVYGSAWAEETITGPIVDDTYNNEVFNEDVIINGGNESAIEIDNDTVSITTQEPIEMENENGTIKLNSDKYGIRLEGNGLVTLNAVGDNVITVTVDNTSADIGDGINVTEDAAGTITLNGGNNTITVIGEHSDGIYTATGNNTIIEMNANSGDNTINADNNGIDHRGNKTITLKAESSNIIKTTAGDGIRVEGTGTVEFIAQNNKITAGDNGIQVEGGGSVNITANGGSNRITANTNGIYANIDYSGKVDEYDGGINKIDLSGKEGFIKVENKDSDVTGIYLNNWAQVDLNTNTTDSDKLEINAISEKGDSTGINVTALNNWYAGGSIRNTNAIKDFSILSITDSGAATGINVNESGSINLLNLDTFKINALTNSNNAKGISSTKKSTVNIEVDKDIEINAKGKFDEKQGTASIGVVASDEGNVDLKSQNGNIIINNIINNYNEKVLNELNKSDIGVQVNNVGQVNLEAKNISINGNQGIVVGTSAAKYSGGSEVNVKSVNINDITATTDGISVTKTHKTSGTQNIVNLDAKENYITVYGNSVGSQLKGIGVNGGIINVGKDENIISDITDIQLIGNTDKKAILYGVRAATATGIDKEEGQVNIESKSINVTVVDNANGDLVHGISSNKGIVDFDSDITKIVVTGAKGIGINSQKEGVVTLNANSINLIYAGELNRGYGKSYAINATGQSDIDLTAGETNLLRGAVYASGHNDTAKTDVALGGNANIVLSNAYIDKAGGLTDKNVISALYAQKGAHIDLNGDYNLIGTYADSNSSDLERVVWAYDTADIDITGLTAISTDSYDKQTNSKDIAIAAGTATGLENLSLNDILNYDTIVGKRASVKVNYESDSSITGDILSAYGGEVNITPNSTTTRAASDAKINIHGNLLAGNNGKLTVDLGKGGSLTGRADDYGDAGLNTGHGAVDSENSFFNPAFSSEIKANGTVNLTMGEGSRWDVTGQSWITSLTTTGNTEDTLISLKKAKEDLNSNASALTIGTLKGNTRFYMNLNGDRSASDMLFIKNAQGIEGGTAHYNIYLQDDVTSAEINSDGTKSFNGLRFATVGTGSNVDFTVKSQGTGSAFDVEYEVDTDSYVNNSENSDYNSTTGGDANVEKPGDDSVNDFFGVSDNNGTEAAVSNDIMLLDETTDEGSELDEVTNFKIVARKGEEISDTGKTILNMSRANYSNAIYMDRLNKRLGEARYINSEEDEGMWVRIRHDRIGKDAAYRSQNTMYELGYDQKQECDNGERRVGMAIDYMHGDTGYDQIAGKGEIDRYGLWLYDTWMGDKGHYADYVAKWGHLSNDFEVYTMQNGDKVTGDYSNNVFSVSAEYGRKKDIGNDWYFEPQVQAQLARVTGADYTTNQGTKVSVDGINSLIGRAGFRLGKDFGEEKQSTVYIKADVLHEFLGDQDVRVLDKSSDNKWAGINYENEGTWYDVGFGFATQMSKNSYAFMDFEKSFGNDNDETYQINVGMQWSF